MQSFPSLNSGGISAAGMDESLISQSRRSRRSNLLMQASIEHQGALMDVTLRNLSAEGALIEGDHGLEEGAEVLFRKGELAMAGRVAWVADRQAGIAFAASLDPEMILRPVPAPRPRVEFVHKRPGFRTRLSVDELRLRGRRLGRPLPSLAR